MPSFASACLALAVALPPGSPLPELSGEFLTGRKAVLPSAASGRVTLLAIGFSYDSRVPVEAFVKQWRGHFSAGARTGFFEVPMIGGMARIGKWFINSGMRRGTPSADHEKVITIYKDAADWKKRLNCHNSKAACLVLLDPQGNIRWAKESLYEDRTWQELRIHAEVLLTSAP